MSESTMTSPSDAAYIEFVSRHPGYAATVALDDLRRDEYSRLDRLDHVYLDYTGGGLYAESQVRAHHAILDNAVFGNPHSHNPASLASTAQVEKARCHVYEFFNADPNEYEVIFTSNASGALKLVGESYPFDKDSCYLLAYDNHNSVNGIREFARNKGAQVSYIPVRNPELRLDESLLRRGLAHKPEDGSGLFAYPAQSNFSGVKHPLEWIAEAQALGWDVLLDCAAYAPTSRIDLGTIKPDFVPLSFYKMFGYPTGVGALIARKDKLTKLRRPWFAGGTITLASVQGEGWYHLAAGATGFEDGTVDYLSLPAVSIGLEHLSAIGLDTIQTRTYALADWTLGRMRELTHSNGAPMFRIFGPETMDRRGATIAFYLLDPDGLPFEVYGVESAAGKQRISIRTGCFCNPGDGEVAHDIKQEDMAGCFSEDHVPVTLRECQSMISDTTGKLPNTIRMSLGIASNFADVYRFIEFTEGYRDRYATRG